MKELDLHGLRHQDVQTALGQLFVDTLFPVVVITGNSRRMKELVAQIAANYDLKTRESITNTGRLVVYE
jgi:DNA-nicking Smr family endonuclease